jgi:hypothetical protein
VLEDVTLPDGVESIGDDAFYFCQRLTQLPLPPGLTVIKPRVFAYCSALSYVKVPAGVVSVGDSALTFCTSMTRLTIPAGIATIGEGAFHHVKLERLELVGDRLDASVVSALRPCLDGNARVFGSALAGRRFGFLGKKIEALPALP